MSGWPISAEIKVLPLQTMTPAVMIAASASACIFLNVRKALLIRILLRFLPACLKTLPLHCFLRPQRPLSLQARLPHGQ